MTDAAIMSPFSCFSNSGWLPLNYYVSSSATAQRWAASGLRPCLTPSSSHRLRDQLTATVRSSLTSLEQTDCIIIAWMIWQHILIKYPSCIVSSPSARWLRECICNLSCTLTRSGAGWHLGPTVLQQRPRPHILMPCGCGVPLLENKPKIQAKRTTCCLNRY